MGDSLPRFIVLGRPTGTYLRYVLEKGSNHRRLHLSSRVVISDRDFTKLEVVYAPSSIGRDMVHIKSSYNNKFLVLESEGSTTFVARADEPEVDRSKWSCTLFRFTFRDNRLSLLLQSTNAQHSVQVLSNNCLSIVRNSTLTYWFNVTNMSTLAILPKYVAFKGDNGLYLNSRHIRTRNRFKYESDNLLDPGVHHEVSTLPNGNVRLWSNHFGQFWRKSNPEWIWGDTTDTSANNMETVFRPLRLNGNKIALLNLGNNKYCMRWVRGGQPKLIDTLTASAWGVEPLALMEVEEAIRERQIYNIQYNLEESRIYNVGPVSGGSVVRVVNNPGETTATMFVGYSYRKVTQETFNSSHSWKVAYKSEIRVTFIPKVVEGDVTLDASYEGNVEWSTMNETSRIYADVLRVNVPAMTRSVITFIIGRGSLDVPFSYTQRDILPNGREVIIQLDDGIFSGLDTKLLDYDIRHESLSNLSASELEELRSASQAEEAATTPSSKL